MTALLLTQSAYLCSSTVEPSDILISGNSEMIGGILHMFSVAHHSIASSTGGTPNEPLYKTSWSAVPWKCITGIPSLTEPDLIHGMVILPVTTATADIS